MEVTEKLFVTPAQAGARRVNVPVMGPRLRGGDGRIAAQPGIDWPATTTPRIDAKRDAEIAHKFETLIAETLLRAARAVKLGDDGLGAAGDQIRSLVDHQRAEAIARAAPLGVTRLLQAAPK